MNEKLHAGDIIETFIEAVAFGGSGVGRVGGMVIFVPFTAAGDTVEAKIVEAKRNYCIGEIREIITPSPDRVRPVCTHFSICGGCQYQHISYEAQLKIKEKQVAESFERIGKIASPPVRTIIPSPQAFNYRGKAEFHCIPDADEQLHLGFMDTVGGKLVEIETCNIVDESINREYRRLREMLASGEIPSHRRRYILWSETAYPPEKYITRKAGGKELRITNS
ncbi:MAG: class I SAM-dependent RNA methyltransferase, partial [Deltaproteobacteria bacterium]|nr:class I SAM-dependent RNA methyltransferase [Deltaproteobacteria bacterium]